LAVVRTIKRGEEPEARARADRSHGAWFRVRQGEEKPVTGTPERERERIGDPTGTEKEKYDT